MEKEPRSKYGQIHSRVRVEVRDRTRVTVRVRV